MMKKKIDTAAVRESFDYALESHDQAFGTFFLARLLGFEIEYTEDSCEVSFEIHDFMFNPQGSLHGGIIALAMDVSMGHLLKHKQGAGATLEMKTQYLLPLRTGRICAIGQALRQGRGVWFLESRLLNEDGQLAAYATSTWKVLRTV